MDREGFIKFLLNELQSKYFAILEEETVSNPAFNGAPITNSTSINRCQNSQAWPCFVFFLFQYSLMRLFSNAVGITKNLFIFAYNLLH